MKWNCLFTKAVRPAAAPLLLVLTLQAPRLSSAEPYPVDEYSVKAAFVYNFAKFVRWPRTSEEPGRPVLVGVFGEDPFGRRLDAVLESRMVRGRRFEIRRIERLEELRVCDILFISSSARPVLEKVLDALEGTPVLTIGDTDGFARQGVVINLVVENRRVRFDVNADAARRNGLNLSSQLLRLARRVQAKGRSVHAVLRSAH